MKRILPEKQNQDHYYIEWYLSSLFNEKNHISFSNFVQNLRIEEAKILLKTTKMKVNDISKKVGYENNSYFVNQFTKNIGMTPNEYREKT